MRPLIATLKSAVERTDIVEPDDCNAPDCYLLVTLKAMRNTVPVPPHWLEKKKFLQGKRGFIKPPYKLPEYIENTGITKMREARLDHLGDQSLKQRQREKMRPKRGQMEIDYRILHDAFFRHQTKPPHMTTYGDLYYEGKEFELRFRKCRPGFVSDRLKRALGMTPRYKVVAPDGVDVQEKKEVEGTNEIEWVHCDQATVRHHRAVGADHLFGEVQTNGPGLAHEYTQAP